MLGGKDGAACIINCGDSASCQFLACSKSCQFHTPQKTGSGASLENKKGPGIGSVLSTVSRFLGDGVSIVLDLSC